MSYISPRFALAFVAIVTLCVCLCYYVINTSTSTSNIIDVVEVPSTSPTPSPITRIVSTPSGNINGILRDRSFQFKNIPYAQPLTPSNRFTISQPVTPWGSNTLNATNSNGVICIQKNKNDQIVGQEDCLVLHVWVPSTVNGTMPSNLPVYVWIHGGGFFEGSGDSSSINSNNFVQNQTIIIVTLNYRLGPLGYLALSEFNSTESVGNWGSLDQQLAMKWVKQNIAAFGGNPNHITLGGQSAGGFSVCWHMVVPSSQSLFNQAIIESGNCDFQGLFQYREIAQKFGDSWAKLSNGGNCTTDTSILNCLRSQDAATLVKNSSSLNTRIVPLSPVFSWGPTVDNVILTSLPLSLIQKGNGNKIPILLGNTANEGTLFLLAYSKILPDSISITDFMLGLTTEKVSMILARTFNATTVTSIISQYGINNWGSYQGPNSPNNIKGDQILTGFIFGCNNQNVANYYSSLLYNNQSVYMYYYGYALQSVISSGMGARHGSEIEYIFQSDSKSLTWNEEQRKLSNAMQSYWGAFIRSGDPNQANDKLELINWPSYSSATKEFIQFSGATEGTVTLPEPSTTFRLSRQKDFYSNVCPFWSNINISNN